MGHLNIEIKARCKSVEGMHELLAERGADSVGKDRQRDTYFRVTSGRLKLREGEIENALIFYNRENVPGPKRSDVILDDSTPSSVLKSILTQALGVDVVVDKQREIYFIENVKFHLDDVEELGTFVEIEAIDKDGTIGIDTLRRQCDEYLTLFDIDPADLVSASYSDLLRNDSD